MAHMARKKTHLVCQHLEGIHARALEQHQDIIRDYIRGRHGIYALYKRDRLYYVGLASNLRQRLRAHLRDRHKGLWDRFSVYLTVESHHIKELESLFLRILRPKGNSQRGKFMRSEDLKKRFIRDIKIRQRDELHDLTGEKRRASKRKTASAKRQNRDAETALGPYVVKRFKIRATLKGEVFKATVRQNGWIYYDGHLYRTPSALAAEICGRPKNGWQFWKYERAPGEWVAIGKLRH